MAAPEAILINGLKQAWGDAYRAGINRRRRLKNRLASLRNSKRRRVRKKWLKFEPPKPIDWSGYDYYDRAPSVESWEATP